jgi:RHS repeat-associated protein
VASYYDAADRLTATVNVGTNGGTLYTRPSTPAAPSDTALVTSYSYNAAGWVQDTIDPRGIDTRTLYDNLGRTVSSIVDFTTGMPTTMSDWTTNYSYDGDNHVLTVTAVQADGKPNQITQYVYGVSTATGSDVSSNDILAATHHPDLTTGQPSSSPSQTETYTVNALGQPKTYTDHNGTVHSYTYDVLGRQTSDTVTTLGAGVDPAVQGLDTAYDTQGNPYLFTSYADKAGTVVVNQVERTFNGLGQMTGEYQSHSGPVNPATTPEVQYVYSLMSGGANHSRLVSMIYPSGRVVTYNYNVDLDDHISRLSSLSDSSGILESYVYLGLDTVVQRSHPQTGVNLTYIKQAGEPNGDAGDQYTGLDRFGRVVDQRWLKTGTSTATDRFQYTYDRDGNVLTRTNAVDALFSEQYSYDDFNQLISFARGSHTQSWNYDALGNWNTVTTDGSPQTRTANAQNQYTSVSRGTTPVYDKNGNLTTDPNGNSYVYDAWNRLVAIKDGSTALESYTYDALRRRVTEDPGSQLDLYYMAWQVMEEQAGGSTQVQYLWCPLLSDTLVERDSNPSGGVLTLRLYAQQDANRNVTALVGTSGNVQERYVYDPFGPVTVLDAAWNTRGSSAFASRYLFQGLRYDVASGLYYSRNREYAPTLGRFLQQDPLGFNGGDTNLYAYVTDNPPNGTDSTGLAEPPILPGLEVLSLGAWQKQFQQLRGQSSAPPEINIRPPGERMPIRLVPNEINARLPGERVGVRIVPTEFSENSVEANLARIMSSYGPDAGLCAPAQGAARQYLESIGAGGTLVKVRSGPYSIMEVNGELGNVKVSDLGLHQGILRNDYWYDPQFPHGVRFATWMTEFTLRTPFEDIGRPLSHFPVQVGGESTPEGTVNITTRYLPARPSGEFHTTVGHQARPTTQIDVTPPKGTGSNWNWNTGLRGSTQTPSLRPRGPGGFFFQLIPDAVHILVEGLLGPPDPSIEQFMGPWAWAPEEEGERQCPGQVA